MERQRFSQKTRDEFKAEKEAKYAAEHPVTYHLRHAIEEGIVQGEKLNRSQISKLSGVDEGAISRFVNKQRGLDGTSIDKLAMRLGLILTKKGE